MDMYVIQINKPTQTTEFPTNSLALAMAAAEAVALATNNVSCQINARLGSAFFTGWIAIASYKRQEGADLHSWHFHDARPELEKAAHGARRIIEETEGIEKIARSLRLEMGHICSTPRSDEGASV